MVGQLFYYPIHFAAVMGNSSGVQVLLEKLTSSDVVGQILCLDSSTSIGSDSQPRPLNMSNSISPLFIAAHKGHAVVLELLLNSCLLAQAELRNKVDSDEDLDEGFASHGPNVIDPRLQIQPGSIADSLGRTMLHFGAHFGHLDICSLLLCDQRYGIDITQRDSIYRWNALHYATAQVRKAHQYTLHQSNKTKL
ncbi:hypothetical protein Ciccas_006527 [Cichlidogyrus casuarinus]|uniref:Uncharacterized protein n=1 Tax=Cichlidogyrus casuarinus TaxID=1844966 RepID=A0ABD2Q5J1_9PLAT